MAASAQTATLPDAGMIRHDGYAINLPQPRSPGTHSGHHPRDVFYRHYPSAHFPGKFEPPEYPFIFPTLNPTESHFGSSPDEKTLHNSRTPYLSPSIDSSYAPFPSPPSYPPLVQEPRLCHGESYSEYPTFRMSHASLSEDPVPNRAEYNSQPLPHHSHQPPSLPAQPDSFAPYPTELNSPDYYRPHMHALQYPYYQHPPRTLSSSEIHQAPMNSEYHHRGSSAQTQNSERPFKCATCPAGFNRNHDLKRHTRIHLAVKPFPCGWCEKSFSRKDALKRHLLVKGCAGNDKTSVDESIRRAEASKLKKPRAGDPSRLTLPFSANSISPQMNQHLEESTRSPIEESSFLSGSSTSEDRPSLLSNGESDVSRYDQSDRLPKLSHLSEGGPVNDRFAPYVRPAPYHHRSQPNIMAYGRDSWQSSDFKPSGYNSLNEATAVLPPPRSSELPPTSSISNLLDGPDYGVEFRAAYSCPNRSGTTPLYSHPSTPVSYPQSNTFSGEEYTRPLYHSTPRSHTSDSICSSSTMTTSNPAIKSESPTATSQLQNSPSPPITPNRVNILNDTKPIIATEAPCNETTSPDEYAIDIKRERISRSPTPQEFPCISSIRCRPN
ncbi:uncharacterized protein MELLADRAFT_93250 [Melampsora larici-populina 98AG31]|uniref:C2H2-type domain-containing protein n=1 Tax=Melampsora larici-populina (strain 98AG31 / pathotype 3-4-7) TaxID=747676 RepID=F4S4H4_MELLP|nr:uncharacterized protein MELLADRAFT_93250 [Melampsora larici-populina 98AG31]EGG00410.1 hypothetical protein MELLADRAFT_93250 [Melampsora larici-populina 98AG31]